MISAELTQEKNIEHNNKIIVKIIMISMTMTTGATKASMKVVMLAVITTNTSEHCEPEVET